MLFVFLLPLMLVNKDYDISPVFEVGGHWQQKVLKVRNFGPETAQYNPVLFLETKRWRYERRRRQLGERRIALAKMGIFP